MGNAKEIWEDNRVYFSGRSTSTAPEITDPLAILLEARFEPCQVCGEQSSGLHCGAITCEACKKFFLRSINGEDQKYKCVRNKDCIITRNTRTQCQYCRFQKCKMVGMTVKVLGGLETQQTPRVADIFAQISCYVCSASSSGIHFGAITCEGCKDYEEQVDKQSKDLILSVHAAYKETMENLSHCQNNGDVWNNCMNQFKNYANRSVKFATRIPGFMNIKSVEDQVQLVQSSIHSVVIMTLQRVNSFSWNYFNADDHKLINQLHQLFPFIKRIQTDADKIQSYVKFLKLDEKEFALLLSLLIMSTVNIRSDDFTLIDTAQTDLTCALCDYMDCKRGLKSKDFYTLMFLLPSLRKLNTIIQEDIRNEIPKDIELPSFFSRVYLNGQGHVNSNE
ncbi:unnamed protein product [Didymodactylos carnosus]|uniref:Uncharacterized protein n=1 Tax=Didymodactylos carnosus TaxID=1234261 RepID=A0A814BS66_9BILA|nr:unnamed protein product [Didymodactylos carnosus]CAF0947112.1 unnamed protein product [Didymodactylos carnosus]CAF3709555.1 unnamed protein product [Didymodactylos carnosus]CAF3721661.1 unnamed protein product [Didymodactylos carnosus]